MAASPTIGLILLAAGSSTRMGRPKQLLSYRGTTLLRHAALTALETGFGPVVVVLGAEADRCRAEIADLPVHSVVNDSWQEGMGTSIRTGIAQLISLASNLEAILIVLHDQPMINAAKLRELAAARVPGHCAVAAAYGGTLGAPALFARELFDELAALDGNQGARRILDVHRDRVSRMEMPEALEDIDTPADYERLA
jgi:molybdenum cofactor cytidylyltransferase